MSAPLLVLVGPPASGKTTVGTGVAEILGVAFRDTDADVEAVAGTTVADVFVQHGERYFRELEEQAVARALAEHEGVLALGGGAVTSAATCSWPTGGGAAPWCGSTSTCPRPPAGSGSPGTGPSSA